MIVQTGLNDRMDRMSNHSKIPHNAYYGLIVNIVFSLYNVCPSLSESTLPTIQTQSVSKV